MYFFKALYPDSITSIFSSLFQLLTDLSSHFLAHVSPNLKYEKNNYPLHIPDHYPKCINISLNSCKDIISSILQIFACINIV